MWRCEAASRRYLFPPPSKYQVFFWLFLPFFSVVFPSFQISLPFGLSGRSAALRTRPEAPICLSGVRNRLSSLRRAPSGFVTQVFIVTDRKKKKSFQTLPAVILTNQPSCQKNMCHNTSTLYVLYVSSLSCRVRRLPRLRFNTSTETTGYFNETS